MVVVVKRDDTMALVVLYSKSNPDSPRTGKTLRAAVTSFLDVEGKIIAGRAVWSPANRHAEFVNELRDHGMNVVAMEQPRPLEEMELLGVTGLRPEAIISYCAPCDVGELVGYAQKKPHACYVALLLPSDFWQRRENYSLFLKYPPTYLYPLISDAGHKQTIIQEQLTWNVWDIDRSAPGILPSTFRPILL